MSLAIEIFLGVCFVSGAFWFGCCLQSHRERRRLNDYDRKCREFWRKELNQRPQGEDGRK